MKTKEVLTLVLLTIGFDIFFNRLNSISPKLEKIRESIIESPKAGVFV